MYIMRCDRCGNEVEIGNTFPLFNNDQETLNNMPRYLISDLGDTKTITLCPKCEREFKIFLDVYKTSLFDDAPDQALNGYKC